MNAVFISDANALFRPPAILPDPYVPITYARAAGEWPAEEAVSAANDQGGFVFWNHAWTAFPNRMTEMTDFHRAAAEAGQLHGIEIANGQSYSAESFQLALDYGLTPIGVSDVHNLIDWDYEPHNGGHRPVNLVFATDRSEEAIRDALFTGRTVVWFKNLLIGREQDLLPLLNASLSVEAPAWRGAGSVLELGLANNSDAAFVLEDLTDHTLSGGDEVVVPPHSVEQVRVRVAERTPTIDLRFRVRNALSEPGVHPEIGFRIELR